MNTCFMMHSRHVVVDFAVRAFAPIFCSEGTAEGHTPMMAHLVRLLSMASRPHSAHADVSGRDQYCVYNPIVNFIHLLVPGGK